MLERIRTKKQVELAVRFFLENRTDSYISPGDVTAGRSDSLDGWSSSLEATLRKEFTELLDNKRNKYGKQAFFWLADSQVSALAVLNVDPRLSVIEDFLVDQSKRGGGVGTQFARSLHARLATVGCSFVMLETGVRNVSAQQFFASLGYAPASVLMVCRT